MLIRIVAFKAADNNRENSERGPNPKLNTNHLHKHKQFESCCFNAASNISVSTKTSQKKRDTGFTGNKDHRKSRQKAAQRGRKKPGSYDVIK